MRNQTVHREFEKLFSDTAWKIESNCSGKKRAERDTAGWSISGDRTRARLVGQKPGD